LSTPPTTVNFARCHLLPIVFGFTNNMDCPIWNYKHPTIHHIKIKVVIRMQLTFLVEELILYTIKMYHNGKKIKRNK
jgi:hypothetical protein